MSLAEELWALLFLFWFFFIIPIAIWSSSDCQHAIFWLYLLIITLFLALGRIFPSEKDEDREADKRSD